MKKYKWDINELRNNIKLLENMLVKATTKKEKEKIKKSIIWFNYLIELAYSKEKTTTYNDEKVSFEDIINDYLTNYNNTQIKLANIILDTYPIVKDFEPHYNIDYTIHMNNDELLEFTTNFFDTMTDKKTINQYNNFLNNNLNSLHINSCKNQTSDAYGQYFFNPVLRKKYIYIQRNNTILDGFILPHELFHYFFNDFDISNNNLYYTTELEGSFANLLVAEHLSNYPDEKKFLNTYFLDNYLVNITSLLFGYTVINTIKDNDFNIDTFNDNIKKYDFNKRYDYSDIVNYLVEDADTNITYNLSFLGALDLLEIYKNDKEKAFDILRNIRSQKRNCNIIKLLRNNNLTFMDDDYSNFKKYVKQL